MSLADLVLTGPPPREQECGMQPAFRVLGPSEADALAAMVRRGSGWKPGDVVEAFNSLLGTMEAHGLTCSPITVAMVDRHRYHRCACAKRQARLDSSSREARGIR